ncbi:hypothetical protein B0H12DRAFT_716059 [Mycena haematopus]|nr:hypothetical protein B0H12DRAFT_716059 [Mycena haematopus]
MVTSLEEPIVTTADSAVRAYLGYNGNFKSRLFATLDVVKTEKGSMAFTMEQLLTRSMFFFARLKSSGCSHLCMFRGLPIVQNGPRCSTRSNGWRKCPTQKNDVEHIWCKVRQMSASFRRV